MILEGGGRSSPIQRHFIQPPTTALLPPSTPNSISMAYYNENENENFYPIIPAADNVDIYPDLNTGADYTLSLDTWDVNGPNADPLTVMPDPNNYSKHHDHCVVDCCLTYCLQAWRSRGSNIQPRTATAFSPRTLTKIYQRSSPNHSPPVSQEGMVSSLPGWPRNHPLLPRSPATVRNLSASYL